MFEGRCLPGRPLSGMCSLPLAIATALNESFLLHLVFCLCDATTINSRHFGEVLLRYAFPFCSASVHCAGCSYAL